MNFEQGWGLQPLKVCSNAKCGVISALKIKVSQNLLNFHFTSNQSKVMPNIASIHHTECRENVFWAKKPYRRAMQLQMKFLAFLIQNSTCI